MPLRFVSAAGLLVMIPLQALAQGSGFAGSSLGLPASGVPSNPFASNYPSAPPAMVEGRERRTPRRAVREPGLLPPGRIPR